MTLKALFLSVCCLLLFVSGAQAQWQITQYTLKGGWNAIYLSGDATYDTIENLFPNSGTTAAVKEIWRWNPNPSQVQFTESPLVPAPGTPEWSVWVRNGPANTLTQLTGQTAYLVFCTGTTTDTYTPVNLKQRPLPPSNSWVRNGANLMGFPSLKTGSTYPLMSNYFATFPAAIAANAKIYKYIGGGLGAGNPLQVFSPTSERLDRTQAYWFSAEVVGNFYAPLEISLSSTGGLTYGRTGTVITVRVRNRTSATVTLGMSSVASDIAPSTQTTVSGSVPLTRRTYNTSTLLWENVPLTSDSVPIGPQSTVELNFGIDRTAMSGSANDFYASFLRLTDGNLFEVFLPATATKASLAGLWVGDISVSKVETQVNTTASGNTTPRPFQLRTLLHVADDGTASLLSKVFLGQLAAGSHDSGLCTSESFLLKSALGSAMRLTATHLPLNQVITAGSGSVAIPGALTRTVTIPYDNATNPFVHQFHPDHDNKDARFQPVGAGVESYDVTRSCTFTFTTAPPAGSTVTSGWGSSVIGGTYQETITGLHRNTLTVSGTFELRRASEIGTLYTP